MYLKSLGDCFGARGAFVAKDGCNSRENRTIISHAKAVTFTIYYYK